MTTPGNSGSGGILGSLAEWPIQSLTLILGGARSGKSSFGEKLIRQWSDGETPTYIATAQAFDDEMATRIAEHQASRGTDWDTVEAPLSLPAALMRARTRPVLVDCLTLWLSNLMLAERPVNKASDALITALQQRQAPAVLVVNEVGLGIVPDNKLGRDFRDTAGHLNQSIAAEADAVIFMTAGLPQVLKGPGQSGVEVSAQDGSDLPEGDE
ncbi:MAG: bifunctional adenosylcobinamide kinase/adenosylcobinamide-phosphate guanylyltransferase [Alphaproteobacteria bacterium]